MKAKPQVEWISDPLKKYQDTELQNVSMLARTVGLAMSEEEKDEFAKKMRETKYDGQPSKRLHMICDKISELPKIADLEQFILEVSFCRSVDNFLCYISDMLTLLLVTRKKFLTRFSKSVDTELIVDKESINEIIHEIVEREVMSLSHRNIRDLSKFLGQKDKLKIRMFKDNVVLDAVSTFVEVRNLIVHNRGYITLSSLRKSPGIKKLGAPAGKKPKLTGEFITWASHIFAFATVHFEEVMCTKFDLPRPHKFIGDQ